MTLPRQHDLWQRLLSYRVLDAAWEKVRANGGCSGGDNVTIPQFQAGAGRRLADLARAVEKGEWSPAPYRRVEIPKRKGGVRTLRIPSLIDRVLHSAIAAVLTPVLEPQFEEGSFAYRPGRSVKQAVRAIEHWRDAGYWHVIEADIVGYFDAVRHDQLLAKLEAALEGWPGGAQITDLVAHILLHQALDCGIEGKGLAQGSPLSPLLANLYLDALDEEIHGRGIRIVRFADDFVVLCKRRKSAEAALEEVEATLTAHGLELHPGGTRVLDFDRGFEFLGHLFVRSMVMQQVSDPEEDMVSLLRGVAEADTALAEEISTEVDAGYDRGDRVLYVTEPGRRVGLRNLSFSVTNKAGEEIAGIAHARVDRIEIGPGASADWAAVEWALGSETELVLVDGRGRLTGRVSPPTTGPAELHLAQAAAVMDEGLRCELVRRLVEARIRNQRTQLFRLNRRPRNPQVTVALAAMGRHLRKLPHAGDVAALRGLEGVAAAEYWPALGLLTRGAEAPFRRQRPAHTALNAALNYLAALLERDCYAATLAAGLHPGFGLLHTPRDRADAAVFDLMEPFRAPLAEGLAAFLFNAKRLRGKMFTPTDSGLVRISTAGRRALITGYEQALAKRVNAPGRKVRLAWRPMMRRQAQDMARACRKADPTLFRPYLMEA
ncbi:MAG: CRISPR-associated endonuclease Cas1 [Rhodobacterales bacterium]|nr:MAG: CRISPR-associated endonuclease Cas1 [Rhodobacterales bacterium]